MTDTETTTEVTADHHRLHRALAWVGIVTGIVVTVAVIFFSGFTLGRTSGYHGWQRGAGGSGGCPMMQQGGMMRPGMMDPDNMGPGMMRPGMTSPGMMSPGMKPPAGPQGPS